MNVISLFAGCGGLDLGVERAGFNVIWANECDSSIFETYRRNHPNTVLNTTDVRLLKDQDIPSCDGVIGGPPCQAWSEGGKQLGFEDPRGLLFLEYVRIVKLKKPKFFVIENVQGILEDKHKQSLAFIIESLRSIGYSISYQLLNAEDFRIPQDRLRVFFVGIRNDLQNTFDFPNSMPGKKVTLREAIGDIIEKPRFLMKKRSCQNILQERIMMSIQEAMMQSIWLAIVFVHGMSNLLRFKRRQGMSLNIHRHQR